MSQAKTFRKRQLIDLQLLPSFLYEFSYFLSIHNILLFCGKKSKIIHNSKCFHNKL